MGDLPAAHPRSPARFGWLLIALAALGMKPDIARGGDRAEMDHARSEGFGYAPGWNVHVGDAFADTLDVPWGEVLPVAAMVLVRDDWHVQTTDRLRGRIMTEWQPVRHKLVRLFFGQVRERCIVDVTPLSARRCVVLFRAGLATRESIRRNPLLPSVEKAYFKGVRDWQQRVREALADPQMRE